MNTSTVKIVCEAQVSVQSGSTRLEGDLSIPARAFGLVLFAHGSGSSRLSPRNRFVAEVLHRSQLATLLIDLLTPAEGAIDRRSLELRFDIQLLASRLVGATDWLTQNGSTHGLPRGYFGASTGAAAALMAAAHRPELVQAAVSRGGRIDLAGKSLRQVRAATLLIVGGDDEPLVPLNREAFDQLVEAEEKRLEIIPRATHLFEEPGALEQVADLAADWFTQSFRGAT
jgi:dienelactone hydrolase